MGSYHLTLASASPRRRELLARLGLAPDAVTPADIDEMIQRGALRGRLHNEETKATYNLFRTAGGDVMVRGNSLVIRAGVPARSRSGRLWIRIECEGYTIEEQSAVATLEDPLIWNVTMQPSSTPLFMQRLGRSYWF